LFQSKLVVKLKWPLRPSHVVFGRSMHCGRGRVALHHYTAGSITRNLRLGRVPLDLDNDIRLSLGKDKFEYCKECIDSTARLR